jgi:integrase
MSVFKLYTKDVTSQKGMVYFYLYHLPNGQKNPELISLKIKLPKKYVIYSKNEFKRVSKELPQTVLDELGFESVDKLNTFLEEKVQEFIRVNGQREFVPNDNKTLNDWLDIVINRQLNQGTKMRYKNVKNLIEQFQLWYSVNIQKKAANKTIPFKIVNVDYVNDFRKWLLSQPTDTADKRRKINSINSSNYKLKALKGMLNKAHQERYFVFIVNPFDHITFSFRDKPAEILTLDELKQLIDAKFTEVYRRTVLDKDGKNLWGMDIEGGVDVRNKKNKRYSAKHSLDDIRNYFLFQLFSQGIRVSDLVTLKWTHFGMDSGDLRISKIMVKTKQPITILVNDKMSSIISNYIVRYKDILSAEIVQLSELNDQINRLYSYLNEDFYISLNDKSPFYKEFLKVKDELEILPYRNPMYKINEAALQSLIKFNRTKLVKGRPSPLPIKKLSNDRFSTELYDWFNTEKEKVRERSLNEFKELKKSKHLLVCDMIMKLSNQDEFVFTLMDNKYFKNIVDDDFSRLDEDQYRKFQSVRAYYNKLLKLIASQAGINKRLTTHLARHSYTTLMMNLGENINLFDVMTSLGHKHLTTTQTYLKRISNKKIDKLNLVISDQIDSGISINI